MGKIFLFLGALALPVTGWAQSDGRPEILVLGTYHMANPGRDIVNMQADDVLSPKRQREMAQLIEVLKKFRPTKIAIEVNVGSKRAAQEYADYLAGKRAQSRNENDQIGYRLAKELGHTTVYAVDEDGDFPYTRVLNYAKANGRAEQFAAMEAGVRARVKGEGDFLQSHTVLEMLQLMNSDSSAAKAVASYYDFVPYGEPYEYAGPDLIAAWFQRNIRIYRNIVALVESPNDRILVLYGAGHLGWLRQDVANDSRVRLRKLCEFVGQQ